MEASRNACFVCHQIRNSRVVPFRFGMVGDMSWFHSMNSTGTVGILSESAAVQRQGSLTMLGVENDKRPRTKDRIVEVISSLCHIKVVLVRIFFVVTDSRCWAGSIEPWQL